MAGVPVSYETLRDQLKQLYPFGQDDAVACLAKYIGNCRSYDANTAPSIYLLAGPASTGKSTAARAFTQMVNSADGRLDPSALDGDSIFFCEIRMEQSATNEVLKTTKDIAEAIQRAQQALAAPHTLSLADMLAGRPVAQRRLVFFLDEIEKVGGRRGGSTTEQPGSTRIWLKLMKFFESGEIDCGGHKYKLPPDWRPVILLATNMMAESLTVEYKLAFQAQPHLLVKMMHDVEVTVCKAVFASSSPLTSRVLGNTVLFFAYSPEEMQMIGSKKLCQLLAADNRGDPSVKRLGDVNLLEASDISVLRQLMRVVREEVRSASTLGHDDLRALQASASREQVTVAIARRRMPNSVVESHIQLVLPQQVSSHEHSLVFTGSILPKQQLHLTVSLDAVLSHVRVCLPVACT